MTIATLTYSSAYIDRCYIYSLYYTVCPSAFIIFAINNLSEKRVVLYKTARR